MWKCVYKRYKELIDCLNKSKIETDHDTDIYYSSYRH